MLGIRICDWRAGKVGKWARLIQYEVNQSFRVLNGHCRRRQYHFLAAFFALSPNQSSTSNGMNTEYSVLRLARGQSWQRERFIRKVLNVMIRDMAAPHFYWACFAFAIGGLAFSICGRVICAFGFGRNLRASKCSNITRISLEPRLPLLIAPDCDWACLLVPESDMNASFHEPGGIKLSDRPKCETAILK